MFQSFLIPLEALSHFLISFLKFLNVRIKGYLIVIACLVNAIPVWAETCIRPIPSRGHYDSIDPKTIFGCVLKFENISVMDSPIKEPSNLICLAPDGVLNANIFGRNRRICDCLRSQDGSRYCRLARKVGWRPREKFIWVGRSRLSINLEKFMFNDGGVLSRVFAIDPSTDDNHTFDYPVISRGDGNDRQTGRWSGSAILNSWGISPDTFASLIMDDLLSQTAHGNERALNIDKSRMSIFIRVLHCPELALHDIQLSPEDNGGYNADDHESARKQSDVTRPPRHHPLVDLVLGIAATAAAVFVAFKSAEHADDHESRFWWLPFLGFLALAFWIAAHAIPIGLLS
jgi:hypothetical protein